MCVCVCRVLSNWLLTACVYHVCLHLHVSQVMQAHSVHNLVFSSSATVYGDPQHLPIDEQHPAGGCTNPYGKTKYFIEEMIKDHCQAEKVQIMRCECIYVHTQIYNVSNGYFGVSRTGTQCCSVISTQSELIPLA